MKEKLVSILSSLPVQIICGLFLGALFIYASIDKIVHPHAFAKIIHNYKILPDGLIYVAALILPWVEVFAGFSLVSGIFRRTGAIIVGGMLLIFIIAISINLFRGLNFDCGCFSTIATENGSDPVGLLVRDFLLLIPVAILILFNKAEKPKLAQV